MSVYPSVHLLTSLYPHCLFAHQSVYPYAYLSAKSWSIFTSVYLQFSFYSHKSICPSVHLLI
jgi:hypothetical protein